jgi:hypothetical protein
MNPPPHRFNGARSMIILHDQHLRSFVDTWKRALAASIQLPETADPSYASMQSLLRHVLRAARGYMVWMCEMLELPDPSIEPTPDDADIEAAADAYLEHLADRWSVPLVDVAESRFEDREYASRWGTNYCIDAMMEHAVMHPLRHEYQLRVLLQRTPS